MYNSLQLREIFHIEFLRWFSRKVKPEYYGLKGGTNIRFFFHSFRYSEDMDIDILGMSLGALKDTVMNILDGRAFKESLKPFGIKEITPPNIIKAKQTETTQRFKVHIITNGGEDLSTKVEFSRRGFKGNIIVGSISDTVLRPYKLLPLLIPHYDVQSVVMQKLNALAKRTIIQARDIFDLYLLIPQLGEAGIKGGKLIDKPTLLKAYENIFEVDFEIFRDTVISYLAIEDQAAYRNVSSWEEVRLKVSQFIEGLVKTHG
ncbi:MAG: nucleotidyl transferase AbiEii/AbiGii toxin family protein [Candidatus Omnitrophota bacterium]